MIQQFHSRNLPKNIESIFRKDLCAPIFIDALYTINKIWQQHMYPRIDTWIKKALVYIHSALLPAIRKEKVMYYAVIWMDLESIMLK